MRRKKNKMTTNTEDDDNDDWKLNALIVNIYKWWLLLNN